MKNLIEKKYFSSNELINLESGYILESIDNNGEDYILVFETEAADETVDEEYSVICKDEYIDEADIDDKKIYVYYDESGGNAKVISGQQMRADLVTRDVDFDNDVYASEVFTGE